MFDCRPLDAMRTAYSYDGEYAVPPSVTPVPGRVRYYFICRGYEQMYGVPYASHFYDQPSHKIGHLVKPPGYHVEDGSSPLAHCECKCCETTKPCIDGCDCPADLASLFLQVDSSPVGGFNITAVATWRPGGEEYRYPNDLLPAGCGFEIESITWDDDDYQWVVHFSTTTGFADVALGLMPGPPCRWYVIAGDVISPDVTLGETVFRPFI